MYAAQIYKKMETLLNNAFKTNFHIFITFAQSLRQTFCIIDARSQV